MKTLTAKYLALCFLLFTSYSEIKSQINASATDGCAPLTSVAFSTSYNSPSNIVWDFDDGGGAAIENPEHTFVEPGIYTVTFSATVGGQSVNDQISITVNENPTANFTAESGCTNTPLQFTDNSTPSGNVAIVGWEWTFGDGNVDNVNQNPTHSYGATGSYDVGLIVTDQNGCTGAIIIDDIVNVVESPSLTVSANPGFSACEAPFDVSFNANASSNVPGSNALTYSWSFGNGNTSEAAIPPQQTYTEEGTFPTSLTVTDELGCSTTVNNNVVVQDPVAAFSIEGGEDGVICLENTVFNESDFSVATFNFGTGNIIQSNPSFNYTFPSGGVYDVTMTVGVGSCTNSITQTYEVEDPEFEITSDPTLVCEVPSEIQLTFIGNATVDSIEWSYSSFVDTIIPVSAEEFTAEIFYLDTITYQINGYLPLIYQGSVVTDQGCTTNVLHADTLWQPNAMPWADISTGCAPLTVNYADSSITFETQPLVSWQWNINGDIFNNSTNQNVEYTFDNPGVYPVQLIVENSAGCIDTSYVDSIYVGEPLPVNFDFNPNPVCINEGITFEELTNNPEIDYWYFNGDNNTLEGCFIENPQTVVFNNLTGTQDVELTTIYNGCESTVTQEVEVQGAVGKLSFDCNCDTPLEYTLNADVQNASMWDWDFGDGTVISGSTETQMVHEYLASGDYNAVLTTYSDDGCAPYLDTLQIKVRQLSGTIASDSLICSGIDYPFQVQAVDNKVSCTRGYHIFWNDDTPPDMNNTGDFEHAFQTNGDVEIEVAIIDDNGCRDTLRKDLRIYAVQVEALSNIDTGCLPLDAAFTGSAIADTTIADVIWNFGDGNFFPDSLASHQYNFPVNFDFFGNILPWTSAFTVTDVLGCSNTASVEILPIVPEVNIAGAADPTLCVGDNTTFSPSPNNSNWTYLWDFGFTTSNEAIPDITFNDSGAYDVTLSITDENGCPAETEAQSLVNVQNYPDAIITSTSDELEVLCYPLQASFTNSSNYNGSPTGGISWDLDSGSPIAPNNTVGFTYDAPGTYEISMEVSTSNGCSDIAYDTLIVVGPVAQMNVDPNIICKGDEVNFLMSDTTDVWTWEWDFGDGQIQEGINFDTGDEFNDINHTYGFIPPSGQVTASLTVWSLDSVCSFAYQDVIEIYEVIAGFEINGIEGDIEHCDDIFDGLNNTSQNADIFQWDLGELGSSQAENPDVLDYPPGLHLINLIAESSEFGCTDTVSHEVLIFPLPEVTANGGFICAGESIELDATGAETYSWSPPDDLSNPSIVNPLASPDFTTIYTVLGTDTNLCSSADTALVNVFQPIPDFDLDSTIIIGESILLNLPPGLDGYSYDWAPTDGVSCATCSEVELQPLEDIQYFITVEDDLGCFENEYTVFIEVLPLSSVDVPDVFTPNGDFVNDVIYVEGWGIKDLLTFEIYNRWGELVFMTSDIDEGWDGTYKGEVQNMDSYSYIVRVETYIDLEPLELYGMIMLKR